MPTTTACEDLEPQIWFTTVHPIAACPDGSMPYPVGLGGNGVDLDRNGVLEFISSRGSAIGISGAAQPVLLAQHVDVVAGVTNLRQRPVMLSESMGEYVRSRFPGATSWSPYTPSWRDMDDDGDLDALLQFYVSTTTGGSGGVVWIENTGLPAAPPPNPYDLDQDGNVNTADLSLLLLEFTD
jgi:hypothetical protein